MQRELYPGELVDMEVITFLYSKFRAFAAQLDLSPALLPDTVVEEGWEPQVIVWQDGKYMRVDKNCDEQDLYDLRQYAHAYRSKIFDHSMRAESAKREARKTGGTQPRWLCTKCGGIFDQDGLHDYTRVTHNGQHPILCDACQIEEGLTLYTSEGKAA